MTLCRRALKKKYRLEGILGGIVLNYSHIKIWVDTYG